MDADPAADAQARRHELSELRRRVYGPLPDLEHDPEAHARLAELAGAGTRPAHDAAAPLSAAIASPPEPERRPEPASEPSSATVPERATARLRRRAWTILASTSRRRGVTAAVALVLVIAGTAATTTWITRVPHETVAVLPLDAGSGASVADNGTVLTAEYLGLDLARLPGDESELQLTDDCLSVIPTDQDASSGVGVYSCGAGPAKASVPMNVTADSPEILREAFPVGTTLLFVLEDDAVRVSRLGS
ncbi:hypothetical protein [Clavibacter californiensis]|uniref:Anti-sigma-K factor rskA n=1 Tax=Clavibacter californiensis TaxID=1401995 RepID=A0ABX9N8J0_9MICO|nr:hypothetical protein [Clavibacter californiensis]RII93104.1 hypothetical protein DZF98_05210 [Clavibacter californiensis]UKF80403.1 hypothetical protein FGD68_01765 [Clavibacter californiensis]